MVKMGSEDAPSELLHLLNFDLHLLSIGGWPRVFLACLQGDARLQFSPWHSRDGDSADEPWSHLASDSDSGQ